MATAKVEKADDIKCTLTFTMSLGEWKEVNNTLSKHTAYAEVQVIREIQDLVGQLEKTYYAYNPM